MLGLFVAGAAAIAALVFLYAPKLFLILPRTHPGPWLLVLLLYTVVSVYPQELIYRAFLFHRYRPLLTPSPRAGTLILILVSGSTFALMHILFHNWIAVALTAPGGLLFAWRYARTKSLALSSFEHALYGCFLFTIGLGQFFYVRVV
jgi:membrane protease YdiL (CAAX protease family)